MWNSKKKKCWNWDDEQGIMPHRSRKELVVVSEKFHFSVEVWSVANIYAHDKNFFYSGENLISFAWW